VGKKYLITWNAGWGDNQEVVTADSLEEAQKAAYEQCREEWENNSDYKAQELTKELAEEEGLEDELEGDDA